MWSQIIILRKNYWYLIIAYWDSDTSNCHLKLWQFEIIPVPRCGRPILHRNPGYFGLPDYKSCPRCSRHTKEFKNSYPVAFLQVEMHNCFIPYRGTLYLLNKKVTVARINCRGSIYQSTCLFNTVQYSNLKSMEYRIILIRWISLDQYFLGKHSHNLTIYKGKIKQNNFIFKKQLVAPQCLTLETCLDRKVEPYLMMNISYANIPCRRIPCLPPPGFKVTYHHSSVLSYAPSSPTNSTRSFSTNKPYHQMCKKNRK